MSNRLTALQVAAGTAPAGVGELAQLLDGPIETPPAAKEDGRIDGVRIGKLIGLDDGGLTPLVCYAGQPTTAALAARTVMDVQAPLVGREVVLMFEGGDPCRPIVMGCLHEGQSTSSEVAGQVEVDAGGRRLIVTAKDQIVVRCGEASITLTSAGKVLIKGTYVSSHSSGLNRIKGGSVLLN